ncbi:glycosyltransferase family 2 protein [Tumidithrix elongata RA019]|uniref:Beta-monoglucosyldiacylglycerol synthase n=1 Tax=Tumidithrix elongata BACA0141 TaxID=2716417 RepID=A0AAW9Q215_9CYAN|nr:glycosyltransferase family 2 protein [Tumidithrix elongata RA019]
MDQTDFGSNLTARGERRRLKAAIVVTFVYASIVWLHLLPWGQWLILGLLMFMAIHGLRLLVSPPLPQPAGATTNQSQDQELPFFSLLVAAKNEEVVIANLVTSLCQLDYDPDRWEVWIIDDNSSDRTPEVLEKLKQKFPQLKTIRRGADGKGGKSGALNQVLPLTKGEIIGVFDADAQISADFLHALVPLFQRPRTGAVQLRKAIANAAHNFWTKGQSAEMALDIFFQDRRNRVGGIGELRGNGQFVRRSALLECGGWNEETITDDLDLTIRLHLHQWDIGCLSFPAVQEEGVETFMQLWHQRNRWAEGGFQRYLDYWSAILNSKMGFAKIADMSMFLLTQYLLPTAFVPDLIAAIALKQQPLLAPIGGFALVLSTIGMAFGIKRSYQVSWFTALVQTLRGTIYMLHWIPVMASVTLRMSIRPKRLKWVKTVHQGVGNSLVLDELEG